MLILERFEGDYAVIENNNDSLEVKREISPNSCAFGAFGDCFEHANLKRRRLEV